MARSLPPHSTSVTDRNLVALEVVDRLVRKASESLRSPAGDPAYALALLDAVGGIVQDRMATAVAVFDAIAAAASETVLAEQDRAVRALQAARA